MRRFSVGGDCGRTPARERPMDASLGDLRSAPATLGGNPKSVTRESGFGRKLRRHEIGDGNACARPEESGLGSLLADTARIR